ncbi:MAG: histidinol dehydrogenase, partial [Clostridia bacterium]|nr:histidinol dehydrogenase [Clostridia bacterium]
MKIIKVDESNYIEKIDTILNRSDDSFDEVDGIVNGIIKEVRTNGDKALIDYTEKFDGVKLNALKVTQAEMDEALNAVDKEFIEILKRAKANIWDFHQKQLESSWISGKGTDIILGQKVSAIARVGVYVPGGTAAYPSTVLMDVIPAKV